MHVKLSAMDGHKNKTPIEISNVILIEQLALKKNNELYQYIHRVDYFIRIFMIKYFNFSYSFFNILFALIFIITNINNNNMNQITKLLIHLIDLSIS